MPARRNVPMYQPPTAYTGMPTRRARMVERIRKAERPERTIRQKNRSPGGTPTPTRLIRATVNNHISERLSPGAPRKSRMLSTYGLMTLFGIEKISCSDWS